MTTEELTMLLARLTILDNRQVDALTIEAWEPIVGSLKYDDAVAAVNDHFRETTAYLLPAHILERATAHRRRRFDAARRIDHVHTFDPTSGYCTACARRDDDVA